AENRLGWALSAYALLGLGAIVVPIYPTLLEPDIEFILRNCEARAVMVSTAAQLKKISNVRARLPSLGNVLAMDVPAGICFWARNWGELAVDVPTKGHEQGGGSGRGAEGVDPGPA